jgi:hypothetical protein
VGRWRAECAVYLGGPGVVVRCRPCHNIGIVLVEARGMMCVDLDGLSDLELPASAPGDQTASWEGQPPPT